MLEQLQDIFDFTEGLDFVTKYSLIIANFITILLLLLFKNLKT